ncbi:hypothetical protein [Peristeroidobacter agariperforans]|uniref:hypothetical protein n=1 Tax=Peristeroidobacter agariperforans TaxID=268404 RepID=UPI00101BE1F4|nr:hypothetical protein [Peristeroidobacter agariperforans]
MDSNVQPENGADHSLEVAQQERRTIALERIADTLQDLQTQLRTISEAIVRLANRTGRSG